MSEANPQRSARSLIANLPGINRIKAIKDLTLTKLDTLLSVLPSIDFKLNTLLENDSPLLRGVVTLVNVIQRVQEETSQIQQQTNQIQLQASQLQQQIQEQTHQIQVQNHQIQEQTHQIQKQNHQIQAQAHQILEVLKSTRPKIIPLPDSDPESRLMAYLYSYLPSRCAIDIGANIGDISRQLLETGYEVYAFEPFPDTFNRLKERFNGNNSFHAYPFAIGSIDETRELYIAEDKTSDRTYKDSTLFNSLIKHAMPDNLEFIDSVPVQVRSLASLHQVSEIPSDIGLVKIDTEGFDLEVLRGMGDYRYPVVITEFWDAHIPFGQSDAYNRLEDLVSEMKARGYHWYLTIYRVWGSEGISFYCNYPNSVNNSWGNVFFFQDYAVFFQALKWCSTVLATTYFN